MKKTVIIKEVDWENSKFRTIEWEQSVIIKKWTHDYMKKEYIIEYNEILL